MVSRTSVIHIRDAPSGWQSNPDYVYIGRAYRGFTGTYGNPFVLLWEGDRARVLAQYQAYADEKFNKDARFREKVNALKGKTLVCFCAPKPCHGDVLAMLAEREPTLL